MKKNEGNKIIKNLQATLWVIDFNKLIEDDKIFTAFNEAEGDKDEQLKILQGLKGIKVEDQDIITIEFE